MGVEAGPRQCTIDWTMARWLRGMLLFFDFVRVWSFFWHGNAAEPQMRCSVAYWLCTALALAHFAQGESNETAVLAIACASELTDGVGRRDRCTRWSLYATTRGRRVWLADGGTGWRGKWGACTSLVQDCSRRLMRAQLITFSRPLHLHLLPVNRAAVPTP